METVSAAQIMAKEHPPVDLEQAVRNLYKAGYWKLRWGTASDEEQYKLWEDVAIALAQAEEEALSDD